MNLEQKIESILFYTGEDMSIAELANLCECSDQEIRESLTRLFQHLKERGINLLSNGDKVALGTHPETAELIKKVKKEELAKPLGKAGLETLAVILYRGPVQKSQIDYIRGVNSAAILRNLQVRGLIEKMKTPHTPRVLYRATNDSLRHLGITHVNQLPRYEVANTTLKKFEEDSNE